MTNLGDVTSVLIIDDEPVEVMNAAGVAHAISISPLGEVEALRRLRRAVSADHYALINTEYDRLLEESQR